GAFRVDLLHQAISYVKNQLVSEDEIVTALEHRANNEVDPYIVAEIFKLYNLSLRIHNAVDFDDCIYLMIKLLAAHPDLTEQLSDQYQYFLIDEFQDTNLAQLKVVEYLCKKHANVCVVGDDDQSIYSWRGANAEIFMRFEEIFPS